MAETKKLGELLKDAGVIDDFQLQSALAHQRNWGGKLGTVLVELEFAQEEDVAKVIAQKLRIPYVDLFDPGIPKQILKLIKPELAKKYVVMPVKKEGSSLVVAMSDPLDIAVMDELRFIAGITIRPALALESEIKQAIRKYYDGESVLRRTSPGLASEKAGKPSGKMEIIRGSELNMPKNETRDDSPAILSKEETLQQALQDNKMRIDALISVLIEKGLITRDELVSMIYQKKIGL